MNELIGFFAGLILPLAVVLFVGWILRAIDKNT
ncbi:hypothetical protein [Microcystis phage Mel-JY01]